MKNKTIACLSALAFLLLVNGCSHPMHIDRGRIEDTITLSLMGEYVPEKNASILPFKKPVVIKPNTFFSIRDLNLMDNKPIARGQVCRPDGYKQNRLYSYEVKIDATGYDKPFYGRIAFFSASPYAASKAVTSYFKIAFSQRFSEATEGRTAYYYEYYDNYPTWIMWVSDAPLK